MLPLHFSHLYKFSHVPKSGVRTISLLPSSLHYATSYKTKHCLLGRKYANDTAAPFGSIFSYTSQRCSKPVRTRFGSVFWLLSFGFCICGYSDNSCTFGSMSCFSYTTFRGTTVYGWFLEAKCMFSCVFSPIWAFSGESNHP